MAASQGAIRAGRAFVEIFADDTLLRRGLKSIQGRMSRAAGTIRGIGAQMAGVGIAIGAPLLTAINLASDAQETFSKFGQVFGDQADAADKFAASLAGTTGRSIHDIRDAMAAFASQSIGLGYDRSEAREMSEDLAALAIDMSSFHNLDTEDAFNRLRSAMAGSSEVLDRFGINIRASALATKGITSSSSEAEKAMARLQIISETLASQNAIGDAARTADMFANASRALLTQLKDLAIEIGTALIPAAESFINVMRPVVAIVSQWVRENPKLVATVAIVAAGLTAAGLSLVAFGTALSMAATAVGVFATVASAMAGPLLLVGAAAAGLGASFAASGDMVSGAWSKIVEQVKTGDLVGAMKTAKETALALWHGFGLDLAAIWVQIETVGKKVWATIAEFASGSFDSILNLFREGVLGLVDLLTSIPGAESLLKQAGTSGASIRSKAEALVGSPTRSGLDDRFDAINAERDRKLEEIGQERFLIESDLNDKLKAIEAESGLASVPDEAQQAAKSAGDGVRRFQRDRASLARSTSNAFAAARAANVSSVKQKDKSAEATAKATKETADNTKKLVDQNKTKAVGIPVGA